MLLLYVLCVFNPSDSTQVMCLPLSLIQLLSNNFENSQKGGRWTVKAVAGDKLTIILQLRAPLLIFFVILLVTYLSTDISITASVLGPFRISCV